MIASRFSFLEKIFSKWWKKKETPPTNTVTWDGLSMGFPNELNVSQRKWMKLYVRTGSSERSTHFFNRARHEVACFFTKEQLAEQDEAYKHRHITTGRDAWREIIQRHLYENNISLIIGGR